MFRGFFKPHLLYAKGHMLGQEYLPFIPILPNMGVDLIGGSHIDQWLVNRREATGWKIVLGLLTIGALHILNQNNCRHPIPTVLTHKKTVT